MTALNPEQIGDQCKRFESVPDYRLIPHLPTLARLDGRAFHTFTKGLARPFESWLCEAMQLTTAHLLEKWHAAVGYTQSDEITLAWHPSDELPFGGRVQKMVSVLAGMASSKFAELAQPHKPFHAPHMDCRVWQVPSTEHAADVFIWRQDDAVKNSVAMAAQSHYSHNQLKGKSSKDMHEMLREKGVNWNDYPTHFKSGTFMSRVVKEVELSEAQRLKIPEKHRPPVGMKVLRSVIGPLDVPRLRRVDNPVGVLFYGSEPVMRKQDAP